MIAAALLALAMSVVLAWPHPKSDTEKVLDFLLGRKG